MQNTYSFSELVTKLERLHAQLNPVDEEITKIINHLDENKHSITRDLKDYKLDELNYLYQKRETIGNEILTLLNQW